MPLGEVRCLVPRVKTMLVGALDMSLKRAREAHEKAKVADGDDATTTMMLALAPVYIKELESLVEEVRKLKEC